MPWAATACSGSARSAWTTPTAGTRWRTPTDAPIQNLHLPGAFWVVALYDQATDTPVEAGSGTYFRKGGYMYGPLPATLSGVTPSTLSGYQLSAKVAP